MFTLWELFWVLIPEENYRPEKNKDVLCTYLTNSMFIKLLVYSGYPQKWDRVFDLTALEISVIDEPTKCFAYTAWHGYLCSLLIFPQNEKQNFNLEKNKVAFLTWGNYATFAPAREKRQSSWASVGPWARKNLFQIQSLAL